MKSDHLKIGFDRALNLQWLNAAADIARKNIRESEKIALIDEMLSGTPLGKEARRKSRTVLASIWVRKNDEQASFHKSSIHLLEKTGINDRIILHWGRCIATYPFFGFVATQCGRLQKLQDDMTIHEIKRRVVEKYGDTERVIRSIRQTIQTFKLWGILKQEGSNEYTAEQKRKINSKEISAWLLQSFFYYQSTQTASFDELTHHPVFFPFALAEVNPKRISLLNEQLDFIQNGIHDISITIKNGKKS
ncbi:hypothetical protein ACFL5V_03340 [Fibrobacterota bacterium]